MNRKIAVGACVVAASMMSGQAMGATALFAGGCFWSVESNFEKVEGVTNAVSGFAGGHVENPSYNDVIYSDTGHYEVVEITYDPDVIDYETLLTIYWYSTDPTDGAGQFCDRGDNYLPAIFALTDEQRQIAEASKAALAAQSGYEIATEILPAATFYAAEDYHQDFAANNPDRYNAYRIGCRRDARLEQVWGDMALLGTVENPLPQ
ncbi:peptide-methionine (S)-S-oxide reductase MsrA [Pelagibacterium xiamenense]|uniref:peptide-methionine (S)-S-oxide reductase MsrA n=1 Tax=Pelagibacterium xiamenense TaxID=2901140 RepID=UPI001E59CAE5|nr:peptide-methionine (S)-S-oxide reductase MsrA [Pelagibacterium xiamenense]MCD7060065.1 peptide-methionine (S)-S-oxide reductase MsrA [Pelagibacterium xiamenense]